MKKWKVGDFIKAEKRYEDGSTSYVYWVGIAVQLVPYGLNWPQPHGVKIALLHCQDGYMLATNFDNNPNGNQRILYKFKPTKEQYEQIKNAVEQSFENKEIDNLSYIVALNKFKKYDRNYKTRTKSI
jgi:hypothetical protein